MDDEPLPPGMEEEDLYPPGAEPEPTPQAFATHVTQPIQEVIPPSNSAAPEASATEVTSTVSGAPTTIVSASEPLPATSEAQAVTSEAAIADPAVSQPEASQAATSAADPYAGYDAHAQAAYDQAYYNYYYGGGYQQPAYGAYPGYYTGYEAYYDPATYAAWQQQAATTSIPPPAPPAVPPPTLAPPSTTATSEAATATGGGEQPPGPPAEGVTADGDDKDNEAKEQAARIVGPDEQAERDRAEEERRKAAAAAAEAATAAAAEEAARQAAEARRQEEEAAVRAQNLAAQRAAAEAASAAPVGPDPEVLARIQKEMEEAQAALEAKRAAEAAAAEAAKQAKKKPAQNVMLRGARMAFSTPGIAQARIPLSKIFADEDAKTEPAKEATDGEETKTRQQSGGDRAGKLYLPEPMSAANAAYRQPKARTPSRGPPYRRKTPSRSRSRSRSYSRSRSRARSYSRGRSSSRSRSPSRSATPRRSRSRSPTPPPARQAANRAASRFGGAPRTTEPALPPPPERYQPPVPVNDYTVQPQYEEEAEGSGRKARKEKKKHRHRRHREESKPEEPVPAAEDAYEEERRQRRQKHRRKHSGQQPYDPVQDELTALKSIVPDPAEEEPAVPQWAQQRMPTQQPRVAQQPALPPALPPVPRAPPQKRQPLATRLPSPPRLEDLRKKYSGKVGVPLVSRISRPLTPSESESPSRSPSPPPAAPPQTQPLVAQSAPGGFRKPPAGAVLNSAKLPAQVREAAEAAAQAKAQEQSRREHLQPVSVTERDAGVPVHPDSLQGIREQKKRRHSPASEYSSEEDAPRRKEKREKKKRRKEKKHKREKARSPPPPPRAALPPPPTASAYGHDNRTQAVAARPPTTRTRRSRSPSPSRSRSRSRGGSYSSRSRSRSYSRSYSRSFSRSVSPRAAMARARSPVIPKRMRMDEAPPRPSAIAADVVKAAETARKAAQMSNADFLATRPARKVYVGGFPPGVSETDITLFFNQVMSAANATAPGLAGPPVLSVYMNHEKRFAFVEFRTPEEASNAMALDNLAFGGELLKVRRPHDYDPQRAAALAAPKPAPSVLVAAPPSSAGGAPLFPVSQGIQPAARPRGDVTMRDAAREDLPAGNGVAVEAKPPLAKTPTKVLRLDNMVNRSELLDEEEYADILDDVSCEVEAKYGKLRGLSVPRPTADIARDPPGVGLVFLEFETERGAAKAQTALNGRKFGENSVVASFYDEALYVRKEFT